MTIDHTQTQTDIPDEKLNFQMILRLFNETDRRIMEENNRRQEEFDRWLQAEEKKREEEAERRRQEEERRRQEEDRRRKEEELRRQEEDKRRQEDDKRRKEEELRRLEDDLKRKEEADRQRQELNHYLKEQSDRTDRKLNKLETLFTSQWAKFMESLVDGDLVNVLNEFGIAVSDTTSRRKGCRNGMNFEFDIIAHNGDEIVVVEVKTTLRPEYVRDFRERLARVREFMPDYTGKKVIGAMAYLTEESRSSVIAQKSGMLVIRATGDSASIVNPPGFIPKEW